MLSGCCVVSVPGNDWEAYIEHGVNGYVCETYAEMRDTLDYLLAHPEVAYRVGQAGRSLARIFFEHTRYVDDWIRMLGELGVTV